MSSFEAALKELHQEIAQLQRTAATKQAEVERLTGLLQDFPDLELHVGRWKKQAASAKSANGRVTDFESRHNCSCCSDSPLEIWPYLETPKGRIYASPACFMVGERDSGSGRDLPYPEWDSKMREAGIPEELIQRIGYRFETNDDEA